MALSTLVAGQWVSVREIGNGLTLVGPTPGDGLVLIQAPLLSPTQTSAKFLLVTSTTSGMFNLQMANQYWLKRVTASPPSGVVLNQVIGTATAPSSASDPLNYDFKFVAVPSSSPPAFTVQSGATGDALHDSSGVILFAASDDDDLSFNVFQETAPPNCSCVGSCRCSNKKCGFPSSCKLKSWQLALVIIIAVIVLALLIWVMYVAWKMYSVPAGAVAVASQAETTTTSTTTTTTTAPAVIEGAPPAAATNAGGSANAVVKADAVAAVGAATSGGGDAQPQQQQSSVDMGAERFGGGAGANQASNNVNYGGWGYDNVPPRAAATPSSSAPRPTNNPLSSLGTRYAQRRFGQAPSSSSNAVPGAGARGVLARS